MGQLASGCCIAFWPFTPGEAQVDLNPAMRTPVVSFAHQLATLLLEVYEDALEPKFGSLRATLRKDSRWRAFVAAGGAYE